MVSFLLITKEALLECWMFKTYYVVEEWYAPNNYWGWHPIAITTKKAYERFKETGECIYKYYGNRI